MAIADIEERLTSLYPTIAIVEIDALSAVAIDALSPLEQERSKTMGKKRRAAFCAGRAALRIAARRFMELRGLPLSTTIEIGSHEHGAPWVRWPSMPESCYYALSHDSRFAVALFDEHPVGVDVEQLRDSAYHHRNRFLSEHERTVVETAALDPAQSAIRAWSIKEAAVKVFLQPLGVIWKSLTLHAIGSAESSFEYNGKLWKAQHVSVDDHVVTVIKSSATETKRTTKNARTIRHGPRGRS
jgi:phosphopantetheinyl transferase